MKKKRRTLLVHLDVPETRGHEPQDTVEWLASVLEDHRRFELDAGMEDVIEMHSIDVVIPGVTVEEEE